MSNKIKTFVANYLATFLEGAFVEASGDIKHYPKTYTFSKPDNVDVSEPPERQGEFLPSAKTPKFQRNPSVPANKAVLTATQDAVVAKGNKIATAQTATKEKGIETRNKESLAYKYPTGRETRKARYDAKRQSFLRRDREGPGPASFERRKQIEVPGKEQHHGTGADVRSVDRERLPARPSVTNKWGRSANTGAVRVKSQSTKWEPEKKQGPYTVTAPGVSSLHPDFQPAVRRDVPALSNVADKVAHALKRAKLHQNK